MQPRAATLPLLLLLALACRGDRAPGATADTTAAGSDTTTAGANGAIAGADTTLGRGSAPNGRPVPSVRANMGGTTATARAAGAASGTTTGTGIAPDRTPRVATSTTQVPGVPADSVVSVPTASLASGTTTALSPTPAPPDATPATRQVTTAHGRAVVPFAPNERLEFDVRFGAIDVGDAAMQLNGIESVRGHEVYHTVFRVSGGTMFFKVNDRYESWIDTRTLISYRFVQQIDEGSYERERTFEIYPERLIYRENKKPEQKTVAEPLDDGSFFYFVRTIPLEVGRTYTFERYFKPASNPVTIKVLRKERVKVPAGTFDAIVIQPLIKTKGIFGEGGRAEIWLADDSTRAMLQMKSQLKFGSLNLYLKRYRAGTRPGAP